MSEIQKKHSKLKGKLIVFEGIDGSGKSTQCQRLKNFLNAKGIDVIHSFEPTKGPIGTKIRSLASEGVRLPAKEELELFIEDRKNHVRELILPALKAGTWVVLDRYYFSTLAYQSLNGFSLQELRAKNECFAPTPDLLVLLELSVKGSLERINARNEGSTAFESTDILEHCAQVFDSFKEEPFACQISAQQPIDNISTQIEQIISKKWL